MDEQKEDSQKQNQTDSETGQNSAKTTKVLGLRGEIKSVDELSRRLKSLNLKGDAQVVWLNDLVKAALCMQDNPQRNDEIQMVKNHLDAIMNLMIGSIEISNSKSALQKESYENTIEKLRESIERLEKKLKDANAKLNESQELNARNIRLKREVDYLKEQLASAAAKGKEQALQEYEEKTALLQEKQTELAEQIGYLRAENVMLKKQIASEKSDAKNKE